MAARTRKGTADAPWDEKVRTRIKTSMIVNRLTDHVLGTVDMSPSQVTAGLGLLKKTLPDLQAVQHSGDAENPVVVQGIAVSFVTPDASQG
jgi:hypothetical protein